MVGLNGRNPVRELIEDGQTVTVPSGEVWDVDVIISGESPTQFNSNQLSMQVDGAGFGVAVNSSSSKNVAYSGVFKSGTTITATRAADGRNGLVLTGYDVSSVVPNSPFTYSLTGGQSQTVPSSTTWEANIGYGGEDPSGGSGPLRWDVNGVGGGVVNTGVGAFSSPIVLEAGDTISVNNSNSNSHGLVISGWEI
jgi:hypothetical protein